MIVKAAVTGATGGEVSVSWNHDGSGPPTHFNVESQVDGGGYAPLTTVPYVPGEGGYKIYDSDGVRGVQYRVNAENHTGSSEWAESNIPTFPPNTPTNVHAAYINRR